MDLSLDDAEEAFLHDILAGTEKPSLGYVGRTTPGYSPACSGVPLAAAEPSPRASSADAATQRNESSLNLPSSSHSTVSSAAAGRPPLPRNVSLQPRTIASPDLPLCPELPSLSQSDSRTCGPKPNPYTHGHQQQEAGVTSSSRGDPAPAASSPSSHRSLSSKKDVSSDGSLGPSGRSSRASTSGACSRRSKSPAPEPTSAAAPAPTTSAASTSSGASSDACSGAGSSAASSGASSAAPPSSRGSVRRLTTVPSTSNPSATDGGTTSGPAPSVSVSAGGAPTAGGPAVLPSRRARGLLQRIGLLESQLRQMLQAEAEQGPAGGVRHGGGNEGVLIAPHHPQVYLVAEQLCRDYNSSGVALMEAGLDEAAREQLDKALLLAGPGGPLDGRQDKQREMQIVAHNNLACYHRKLHHPALALEHLELVASLETEAAAAPEAAAASAAACPAVDGERDAGAGGALKRATAAGAGSGLGAGRSGQAAGGWCAGAADRQEPGSDGGVGPGVEAGAAAGPTAATLLNLAACCGSLGQHGEALGYAERAVLAAAAELQISLPALENALRQGLPQAQLWDVLPQLRRAGPGTATLLATAYYNRAVEQEHLQLWQPALQSYRLAVDVAGRFSGRGAGLTLTMQQSMEAFKVRLRRLERQGKLRARASSARSLTATSASAHPPSGPFVAAHSATTPAAPAPACCSPSLARPTTGRQLQPRPHLRSLRCVSAASGSSSAYTAVYAGPPPPSPPPTVLLDTAPAAPAPQRRQRQGLPAIARSSPSRATPASAGYPHPGGLPARTHGGATPGAAGPYGNAARPSSAGGGGTEPLQARRTAPAALSSPEPSGASGPAASQYSPEGWDGCAPGGGLRRDSGEGDVQAYTRNAVPVRLPPTQQMPEQQQQQQQPYLLQQQPSQVLVKDGAVLEAPAAGSAPFERDRAERFTCGAASEAAATQRQLACGLGPPAVAPCSGQPAATAAAAAGAPAASSATGSELPAAMTCGTERSTAGVPGLHRRHPQGGPSSSTESCGGGPAAEEGSLAAVAAAAAAATAELARICERDGAVSLGDTGLDVEASAGRLRQQGDGTTEVVAGSCRSGAAPVLTSSPAQPLCTPSSGHLGRDTEVRAGAGGSNGLAAHLLPGQRNMLVPKRDGVTV